MILLVAQRGHNALYVALESGHVGVVALLIDFMYALDNKVRNSSQEKNNKKVSCRRETALRFVSFNILLCHSSSLEMTLLRKACVSPY